MRLLNSKSYQLELFHHLPTGYAIVSHRWGSELDEVLFDDIGDEARTRSKAIGYDKIKGTCAQAIRDGLNYVWLDTCCIDKNNSTELSEAINSMYKWYRKSDVCYAYLHDVSDRTDFEKSEWFTRGWTLQELIAPKRLKFFTKDWQYLGSREDLRESILKVTGICPEVLQSPKNLQDITISQRMCWAAKRQTTKVEDRAYSLLGIFNVSMVPIYGIDDVAFEDLQYKLITKYSDQTLFSWYHTYTQPEDVEMEDAPNHTTALVSTVPSAEDSAEAVTKTSASVSNSAPAPPAPVPASAPAQPTIDSASDSVENDDTFLYNTTGLLTTSPSHYLKTYEISDQDFRKNYVDRIRDISYRSNFSMVNNFVRIPVPIKHMSGKIWKAVLRCSFEPPGGDEVQRPLVIYLKETDPWKYVRVHLAPSGEEAKEGDVQMDDVPGVRGSLERLSDAELQLTGYILREIDVLARYGEAPPEDQPRQLSHDPDTLPELTEAERIAKLPRHPPGVKTTNIIVCGEPGVAAGRTINLIIGSTIIKPLTDYERETMAVTVIDGTLQSRQIRFFYVVGPRDPCLDYDVYHTALRNMYQLAQEVKKAGGIHLVMLCMVGSKVTPAVQSNYRLFVEYVCQKQVRTMLVVTGLGRTRRMDDWWDKHKNDREMQSMRFIEHACITVLQGQGRGSGGGGGGEGDEEDEDDHDHEKKYEMSAKKLQDLLTAFMDGLITGDETATEVQTVRKPEAYCPEDAKRWFVDMGKRSMDLLLCGLKNSLKQEAVLKTLKEGVTGLSEAEANDLAGQFFDQQAMEV
ncbi:heterokaryon incompatibility protein-domain-containing protein [Chiua virens]|nr:heterokaryon incompatibility protein-domain-containing protein [Chiua virens]